MPQIINQLILIIGLFITGFGLVIFHGNPVLFAVIALGIGLVITAFISDKRREQREKEQQRSDIAKRIAQLTQAPWQPHQTLEIKSNQWLILLVVIIGLASIWALHTGLTTVKVIWPLVLGGSAFLFLTVILLSVSLASFGKPACILDRNGLVMPIHGHIPWQEVDGIALQQYTIRGVTQSTLLFRVMNYHHIVTNTHWTLRLFALVGLGAIKRGIVGVTIKHSNENPETIYTVARFLWRSATGRDYEWSPLLSEAYNEAAKRASNIASQHLDNDALKRRLQENPHEVLAEMEQASNDLKFMSEERTRLLARTNRIVIIAIIFLLLGFGWKLLRNI